MSIGRPGTAEKARAELGAMIRGLREAQHLTGRDLARRTEMSPAKVSKIELGRVNASDISVTRIANALRVDNSTHALLLSLVRESNEPTTSTPMLDALDMWCEATAAAQRIDAYCMSAVPLFLQTPQSMQALSRLRPPDQQKTFALMQARRQAHVWDESKRFRIVIHEAALHQPFMNEHDMQLQLDRLIDRHNPHIELGIVPQTNFVNPLFACYTIEDNVVRVMGIDGVREIKPGVESSTHQSYVDHFNEMRGLAVSNSQADLLIERARPKRSQVWANKVSTQAQPQLRLTDTGGARKHRLSRLQRGDYICVAALDSRSGATGLPLISSIEQLRQLGAAATELGIAGVILDTGTIDRVGPAARSTIVAQLVSRDDKLSDLTQEQLSHPSTAAANGAEAIAFSISASQLAPESSVAILEQSVLLSHQAGLPVIARLSVTEQDQDYRPLLVRLQRLGCDVVELDSQILRSTLAGETATKWGVRIICPVGASDDQATLDELAGLGLSGVTLDRSLLQRRPDAEMVLRRLDFAFGGPKQLRAASVAANDYR